MPTMNQFRQVDLDQDYFDSSTVFATPEEVITHGELSQQQKIKILHYLCYDASSIAVAEEEGMVSDNELILQRILHALHRLTGGVDREHSAPTKQGSF